MGSRQVFWVGKKGKQIVIHSYNRMSYGSWNKWAKLHMCNHKVGC